MKKTRFLTEILVFFEICKTKCDYPYFLRPPSPYYFSLFILHWICHSDLKYSCRLWKMNASAESSRSWKEREVSRHDRYSLMMKVTESFESSLASGNVDDVTTAEHKCTCTVVRLLCCMSRHVKVGACLVTISVQVR